MNVADVHNSRTRSYNMSRIRDKDTKPELIVRRTVHGLGFRFRLHRKDLPGRPDLVLPRLRKIIFVHGCFWHLHDCRYGRVVPKANADFWANKRQSNADRDRTNIDLLREAGWDVLTVWECETRDAAQLSERLRKFLAD